MASLFLKPRGKNVVRVCLGTACHIRGARLIQDQIENKLGIKAGNTTDDMEYTLEAVACVGACAMAPVVTINKRVYGNVTPKLVPDLLNRLREEEEAA